MQNDPDAIRREIEQTQANMSDTVEALAYKADVPARAKDAMNERVGAVKQAASDAIASATNAVSGLAANVKGNAVDTIGSAQVSAGGAIDAARASIPSKDEAAARVRSIGRVAADNPIGLVIGSLAVGALVGLILPVSDIEQNRIGPIGDQLTETAKDAAATTIAKGKAAVTQAVSDTFGSEGAASD